MQPRQMAMELQALRGENLRFAQTIKSLTRQLEDANARLSGAHVFEQLLNSAIVGFSSQPRAASNPFWQRSDSGELVPLDGGPQWVVDQAFQTMGMALESLKGTFQAAPQSDEAPTDAVAQGTEEVQPGEASSSQEGSIFNFTHSETVEHTEEFPQGRIISAT